MKRDFIFALAILASAVSCTKEQNTLPTQSADPDSFVAKRETTKSNLDGLTPVWVDGDVLGIASTPGSKLIACPLIDAENGIFIGADVPQSETYYAVTPYSASTSFSDAGKLIASIPSEQRLSLGQNIDPAAMIAAGVSSTREFLLRNCTGLVKLDIRRDGIKQVQFQSSAEGEPVAGKFSIDPAAPDSGIEVIEGSNIITLLPEGESFAQGSYYICVLPCELSGITLTFTDSGDKSVTVTKEALTAVKRNGGINFGSFFTWNISTPDELEAWAKAQSKWTAWDEVNILADIDMAGRTWTPVNFQGTFDGQGHSILNLKVEHGGTTGLFSIVSGNGVIKDLTIGSPTDNSSFTITAASGGYVIVGPIAKIANAASLINVTNYADVCVAASCTDGTRGNYAGGIVGSHFSSGEVSGCVNYGKVSFLAQPGNYLDVGGICGEISRGGTLSNCTNNGEVLMQANKGASTNIGGVAGYLNGTSTITGNVNNASVTLNNTSGEKFKAYIGGVIGFIGHATAANAISPVKISGCRNNKGGAVTVRGSKFGELFVGGVVGYTLNVNPPFDDCHNEADILSDYTSTGSSYPYYGGFAGQIKGASVISNCSSSGNVTNKSANDTGSLRMGGFVGCTASASTFTNCTCDGSKVINEATLGGSNNGIGGFLGTSSVAGVKIDGNTVKNVSVTSVSGFAGLVAGYSNQNISILNNKMSGTLNGAEITADDVKSGAGKIYNIVSGKSVTYSGNSLLL